MNFKFIKIFKNHLWFAENFFPKFSKKVFCQFILVSIHHSWFRRSLVRLEIFCQEVAWQQKWLASTIVVF